MLLLFHIVGILALEGEGPEPKKSQENTVFISYAREDSNAAKRLWKDLKDAGLNPWLDKEELLPGEQWELEIRKAIKNSTYFLAVLSTNSVDKRGYVQKEFKFGLEVLDEVPKSQIFVIPARLNECNVPYEKIRKYQYVDLFPDWEEGLRRILQSTGVRVKYDEVELSTPYRGDLSSLVDLSRVLGFYRYHLEIHDELCDRVSMAADYADIGNVLRRLDRYEEALESHKKALKIHKKLKRKKGLAADYADIGNVLDDMGKYQESLESYDKALKINEKLKDRVGLAIDYTNIGNVLRNSCCCASGARTHQTST